jgi:hypothetical protein
MLDRPPSWAYREMRARPSAYLRAGSRGATLVVGNPRRVAVARLVPVAQSREDAPLERLAARERLRLSPA